MRILIVEDDKNTLEMFHMYLCDTERHRHCDAVGTFREAWDRILSVRYDVIFLDLFIHGRVSTALIGIARERWGNTAPLICVMSAMPKASETVANMGVTFIAKPFDLTTLDEYLDVIEYKNISKN